MFLCNWVSRLCRGCLYISIPIPQEVGIGTRSVAIVICKCLNTEGPFNYLTSESHMVLSWSLYLQGPGGIYGVERYSTDKCGKE